MTPAGQRWTWEKPTVEGWYWYQEGETAPTIVYVEFTEYMDGTAEWRVIFRSGATWATHSLDGQFQGPLTPYEATE